MAPAPQGASQDAATRRDIFLDVGKGPTVLMAAIDYPFVRVIGVELIKDLHDIAQHHLLARLKSCPVVVPSSSAARHPTGEPRSRSAIERLLSGSEDEDLSNPQRSSTIVGHGTEQVLDPGLKVANREREAILRLNCLLVDPDVLEARLDIADFQMISAIRTRSSSCIAISESAGSVRDTVISRCRVQ